MRLSSLWLEKFRHTIAIVAALTGSVLLPMNVGGQTQRYIVSQLSSDDATVVPCKLNNLGDLAGSAAVSVGGETRATIWNHSTLQAKHLGVLPGGEHSSAFGINDAGQVAGASNIHNAIVPFIGKQVGGLQRIPLLRGDKCGQIFGINTNGHVAGLGSSLTHPEAS
jgi:hypothetical protein